MERYLDAALDIGFMVAFTWLFSSTGQGGMIVSMVGSAVVSVILLKDPLNFAAFDSNDDEESEVDKLFSTGVPNGSA